MLAAWFVARGPGGRVAGKWLVLVGAAVVLLGGGGIAVYAATGHSDAGTYAFYQPPDDPEHPGDYTLLRWTTADDGTVTGEFTEYPLDGRPPAATPVTGRQDGDAVSFTTTGSGAALSLDGTITGDDLTIRAAGRTELLHRTTPPVFQLLLSGARASRPPAPSPVGR
jgi:hypothetical protein